MTTLVINMGFTGKKHTEETKKKMKENQLGKNNSFYGKTHTEEIKQRISSANKGRLISEIRKIKLSESRKNTNNPNWKGDNVGYNALHGWVNRYLPIPQFCEMCNSVPPYDLANITGVYNREFKNWARLCRKCHMKSDGRFIKIHKPRNYNRDPITGKFC